VLVSYSDLKGPNVLLDDQGNAKVADFGTVREGVKKGEDDTQGMATHTVTARCVGTTAYMPPEYATQGIVSEKTDIYAFAIVLIELLTAKTGSEMIALHCDGPELFEDMQRHVDARGGAWPAAVVKELAAVAEQCIAYHARARPKASEVIPRLEALL
jgi:serine/threonine protein kinase